MVLSTALVWEERYVRNSKFLSVCTKASASTTVRVRQSGWKIVTSNETLTEIEQILWQVALMKLIKAFGEFWNGFIFGLEGD